MEKGICVGVMSSPVTSKAWDVQGAEAIEGFDDINSIEEDVEEKPAMGLSSFDIVSWSENVVNPGAEPVPQLIPTSFKKGVISGSSANNVLMIKGLIDPPVYVQFLELSSFSCL